MHKMHTNTIRSETKQQQITNKIKTQQIRENRQNCQP